MGVVIGAYYFDIGIGTAFLAEISALIQGIEYAHQRGWHKLWIELLFSVCSPPLICLLGGLLRDGIIANGYLGVCASTALISTGRAMRWRIVWHL